MRLDKSRASRNIEDRRAGGPRLGRGSIGIGTIVLALVAMYFGVDPSVVLQLAGQDDTTPVHQPIPRDDPQAQFVARVLGDTEDVWTEVFRVQTDGQYQNPTLVLYRGVTPTACGTGQAAMGPFYCPGDAKVYLDLSFFDELARKMNAPGDSARAYVIAHEIGHHVQHQLGQMRYLDQARQTGSQARVNRVSVRVELQADCYAGLWAHHANRVRQVFEPGDLDKALSAANAVGDDTLQRERQGTVVPDSFTHGTSAQRMAWFERGFDSGELRACDTFSNATP